MSGQYTSIIATDYNTIQKNIAAVLGSVGTNPVTNIADLSFGYNQSVSSSQIAVGAKISSNQWTNLRTDILRARQHQTATTVSLTDPTSDVKIIESDRAAYATMALDCITDRTVIPPIAQATRSAIATNTVAYSWNGTLTHSITVDFADITAPLYYFNSGGLIEFTASRVNGTVTTKNTAWATLLTNMGTISFGRVATAVSGTGTSTAVGWLDITTTDQLIFTKYIENSLYLNDNYKIFVKQGSTAAQLIFTVQFNDVIKKAGSPGGIDENITGTLTSTVSSYRATGGNVQVAIPTASATIDEALPYNNKIPVISGITQVGSILSTTNGDWDDDSSGYTYQWQRGTTNIVGQIGNAYTLTPADVGSTLRVIVTSTNFGGSTAVTSLSTGMVIALAPENTVKPAISGTRQVSKILTTDYGTWLNTPTSYLITWYRDTTAIPGASGPNNTTYTLTVTDLGKTIHVVVTAYNTGALNGITKASDDTVAIIDVAPSATTAPTISTIGVLNRVGSLYTTTDGTWGNRPILPYLYKWQRNSVDISGETTTQYTLKVADIGTTIRSVVIATNTSGINVSSPSSSTASVIDYAPVASALPVISGGTTIGGIISMTTAPTWNNSVNSITYSWNRSNIAIAGASSTSYTTVALDIGKTISLKVTATNSGGSVTSQSAQTAAIIDLAPVNSVLPTISGSKTVGSTLSATAGTWTQGIPTSTTYQWYRGTSTAVGTNSSTYTLTSADYNNSMHVTVTVYNSGATSGVSATSANTVAITAVPVNSGLPTITASPTVIRMGTTLTSTNGTWSYSPTSYAISWYRGTSTYVGSGASYVLATGDVGYTMYSSVTASNAAGTSSAATSGTTTAVLDAIPTNSVAPTLSAGTTVGNVLSISNRGTWANVSSYNCSWQRNNVDIAGYSYVPTTTTYTLLTSDIGKTIRAVVNGTNRSSEFASAATTAITVIDQQPVNAGAPSIGGTADVGQPLSITSNGTWNNSITSYSYQWQRNGGNIATATGPTYVVTTSDINTTLSVVVTATNSGGSATATTNGLAVTTRYFIEISSIMDPSLNVTSPTSTAPVTVVEGSTITMLVYVSNSPASMTTLWWQGGGGGVSPGDFYPNTAYRGAITMATANAGPGYSYAFFDVEINADTVINEPAETFIVALRTGSQGGPDVAYSQYITIRGEYSTPGTYTFTVPTGVTVMRARVIGGGGGGNTGQGGGAAGYIDASVPVTAGQVFTVTVGAGGNGGNATACTSGGRSQVTDNNGTYVSGNGGTRATTTAVGSGGGAGWNVFTEIASAIGGEGTLTAGGTNTTTFGGSAGNGGAPLTDGINGLVHVWYY